LTSAAWARGSAHGLATIVDPKRSPRQRDLVEKIGTEETGFDAFVDFTKTPTK
jgi:hypothetical protein